MVRLLHLPRRRPLRPALHVLGERDLRRRRRRAGTGLGDHERQRLRLQCLAPDPHVSREAGAEVSKGIHFQHVRICGAVWHHGAGMVLAEVGDEEEGASGEGAGARR